MARDEHFVQFISRRLIRVLGSTQTALFAGAAAIVSGALWLERRSPGKPVAALRLLGDASYSIYLFPTPFLLLFDIFVVARFDALSSLAANAMTVAAIVAALAVGVLLHLTVEKPALRILNGWNRRLLARVAPAAPLPS